MLLVERDSQLAALEEAHAGCMETRGSAVVVTGAAGTGKTALLEAFGQYFADSGAVFLTTTASRAERSHPLGVVGQLFDSMELSAGRSERATQLLDRGVAAVLRDSAALGSVPQHVLHGLYEVILELTEAKPVIVIVDDVHHADPPSLDFLLYLVRRLRTARLTVVISEDSSSDQEYLRFRSELFRLPHFRKIQLSPLSLDGVAELLAARLDHGKALQVVPSCHRTSGGNPLMVRALLDDYVASGRPAPSDPVPGRAFAHAVVACLYRCEHSVLNFAKVLAVLGDDAEETILEEILEADSRSVSQAADALNLVGLCDGHRFRHDAIRLAVLDNMPLEERSAIHARAAEVLHNHGWAPASVARHLVATERGKGAWGVAVLREAAEQAMLSGDTRQATVCLRRAYQMCHDQGERATIKAALAHAEWRHTPSAVIRHISELTTYAKEERLSGRDVVGLIGYLTWYGRIDQAVEVLDAIAPGRGHPARGSTKAANAIEYDVARLWLCCLFPDLLGRLRADLALPADEALGSVETLEQLRAAKVLSAVLTRDVDADALIGAEQVLQGASRDGASLEPVIAAMAALICLGMLEKAAFWCEFLLKENAERHGRLWQALLWALHSNIKVRQGRMVEAERSAHTALSLMPPRDWGMAISVPLAAVLLVKTAMGKHEEAAAYLRMPVPKTMLRSPIGLRYLHARGKYYLATGRNHAALSDFQTCGELMVKWRLDMPSLVPWRTDAAEAFLTLGKYRQARDLVYEQLVRLKPEQSATRGLALRVLAMASDTKTRPPLLREAADALRSSDDRFELAVTIAELGRAHQALGEEDPARKFTAEAHRLAEECGIEPPRSLLQGGCDTPPSIPPAEELSDCLVSELSDAERRVAELASQGYTNRQIANKLFITVSTVEQHLTRVYRKLKVNRRTELQAKMRAATHETISVCVEQ